MDYKEKYEQALERARKVHTTNVDENKKSTEYIFPELKESEDENVRKHLLRHFSNKTKEEWNGMPIKNIIDWLEKQGEQNNKHLYDVIIALWDLLDKIDTFSDLQIDDTNPDNPFKKIEYIAQERHKFVKSDGYNLYIKGEQITDFKQDEQKPTDKVEPKFKVNDWITDGTSTFQIVEIRDEWYIADDGDRIRFDIIDQYYHLWTIQDAKPGDVLAFDWKDSWQWQKIVIFKSLNEFGVEGYGNTFKNNELAFKEEVPYYSKTWTKCLYPATKEQRDLLFQKMKEVGYEWDVEKKELKKIEQKPTDIIERLKERYLWN